MPRPLFICTSLLLLFPSFLAAQRQAPMHAAPSRPMPRSISVPAVANNAMHPPSFTHLPVRSAALHNRNTPASSRTRHSQFQFSSSSFDDQSSDFPVPGLGFDAVHFAATHPQASNHRHHGSNFLIPLYGGEYFFPYPLTEESPAQTVSQTSDEQDDLASEDRQSARRHRPTEAAPVSNPAPEQTFESPRNSDEYIFVRRDGTLFFAVAYSWDRKTLRYITQQGLRQSLSSDALDLGATHQFNEQRGLSFRPPA